MKNIAITGSIAFDYIMSYPGKFKDMLLKDSLDHISVSFLVDELTKHRGGVAANIAYTLGLLGEHPYLVATAGSDFSEFGAHLDSVGVNLSGTLIHPDLFCASFFVSTDEDNNQIASFYTGAMARSRDLALKDAVDTELDLVVVSPNDPVAMSNYVRECKSRNIPYIYDPGQQVARVSGDELKEGVDGAYMLILNEYEYEVLQKKIGLDPDSIKSMVDVVIVTLGENGADIYADERVHVDVVPPLVIKDPTGVGDAFRAGLLKGMSSGYSWELCGQIGSLCATYVLEQVGPQNHRFTGTEFVSRFRQHFSDNGQLNTLESAATHG